MIQLYDQFSLSLFRFGLFELPQLIDGGQGLAVVVVEESPVDPVVDDAVAVFLREPPIESVHVVMLLQLYDEVFRELTLPFGGGWPFAPEVVADAIVREPLVVVGGLHDLHPLVREALFQAVERVGQDGEVVVPEGVIAQSDDVIIHVVVFDALEVVVAHVGLSRALYVDDDFRLRAYFPAGLGSILEELGEDVPVLVAAWVHLSRVPQHSVGDLIAYLDEVRLRTLVLQGHEAPLGVVVQRIVQGVCVGVAPGRRRRLLAGIRP